MLARFGIALLIFFGGMDLVWLGCQENGSNNRFNPIWGFVDGIVTFEKYALFAALAAGVLAVVFIVIEEVSRTRPAEKSEYQFMRESRNWYEEEKIAREARAEAHRIEANRILNEQASERQSKAISEPNKRPIEIKAIPPKPKPSADELKQKAIQDLLGR